MFSPTSLFSPTTLISSIIFLLTVSGIAAAQPSLDTLRGTEAGNVYAYISVGIAPTGSIAGTVVNDPETGDQPEGVAGVRVLIRPVKDISGTRVRHQITDQAGQFKFSELGLGQYVVTMDPISIPTRFRAGNTNEWTVDVRARVPATVEMPVIAERSISGIAFIDRDGNGVYKPGKDEPVQGALITVAGDFATTRADGSYSFRDLPAGRLTMLVEWPGRGERTHVLLHLPNGPVKNRIVNIARER